MTTSPRSTTTCAPARPTSLAWQRPARRSPEPSPPQESDPRMQLYCDPASTTGRPLLMLIAELGLDVEIRPVSLMAGEHRTPEFLALNPNGQVPVLVDGPFRLTESGAILRYLATLTPSRLIPIDRIGAARLDEALDWFKTGFSADFCAG